MTWVLLVIGLTLAFVGSAGAAALVTTARVALTEAVSRRLRGTRESLAWLATTERKVVAATAAASFGAALVGAALPGIFAHASIVGLLALVLLVGVPATLLGGYVLPRSLTLPRAARVVEVLHPVLSGWASALGIVLPSRQLDPRDDVRALAREGSATGVGGAELVMVGGVLNFGARPVRAVMTPRTDVVAVAQDADYAHVESVFAESGYTRIPVYGATLDEIVGMIHAFDLFKYQDGDPLPLRRVSFAPELRPAGDVLLDMQRERQHLTVVVDEFGGTAGIVTLENLLEALVGEIADEDDAVALPISTSAAFLEIDGAVPPAVVAQHFGVELPLRDAVSFGGLIAELLGRIPVAGERLSLAGLEIDVVHASPIRVDRMLVRAGGGPVISLDRAEQ
ncbi:MAG TPA: CBS domain-containing protein [Gemmatimonadales bacterium]|jgi:CBS domain containing-hemolysin-like protein